MKHSAILLLLLTFAWTTGALSVFAHGTGVSYEETKEGYKIDIGHDEFIAALESTRFDFALYPEDIANTDGEVYTDVWVTLTKDKKLFFGGAVDKPVFGATGFTFVFPETGTYIVSARFQKDGETVTKAEFPLTIISPLETKSKSNIPVWMLPVCVGFASLLVGCAGGFLLARKKILYGK